MNFPKQIKKAAVATLTIGALAVSSFGLAGTASADEGGFQGAVSSSSNINYVYQNALRTYNANQNVAYYNAVRYGYNGYVYPVNYIVPMNSVNYNFYSGINVQSQFSLIANTSEILGISGHTVMVELNQGRSLTQIAAIRGMSRPVFLNSLSAHVHADINAGYGNVYTNQLFGQISSLIDVSRLGVSSGNASWATLWNAYPN